MHASFPWLELSTAPHRSKAYHFMIVYNRCAYFRIELLTAVSFWIVLWVRLKPFMNVFSHSRNSQRSEATDGLLPQALIFILCKYIASVKDTIWLSIMSLCVYGSLDEVCLCVLLASSVCAWSCGSGIKAKEVSSFSVVRSSHFRSW